MTKREGSRPDSRKRPARPNLEFERLPELRPGPLPGYRGGLMRGFALGWLVALLGIFLVLGFWL